ncbi:hypothetical protein [Neobacillus sp.]|uniref:hypothetical protein n=1 Tax=Neobacillus sp. TaxID=2675273 RepID=UPI0028997B5C|nr:hypothetical protein [Neobacillus sp.]
MMLKKWIVFSLVTVFILSGCQSKRNAANDAGYDLRTDRSTPNYMSNRGKNQQHLVEDDITNQNPNFLDLEQTGSGGEAGAGNYGNDTNKAKQVIADTNEFVTDSVWINGNRMWVSVYKKGMLSNQERINAEARLHRNLMQALPRYQIEVRVKEDRR